MARILYGVSGEGSGHSSRAREIISWLEKNGHLVKVVSYDRGYRNLKPFFDVDEIFGLRLDYKNNEVRQLQTVFKNLINAPKAQKSIAKVSKIADSFKPDLVFSDFEPISCIVANLKKIPLISIDNQHRFNNTEIKYPTKYKPDAVATIAVANSMIFGSKACLVTTFSKSRTKNSKTFLFPPILRREVLEAKSAEGNYILVYLTSEFKKLPEMLKKINKKFVIYGFDESRAEGNLIFKKASQEEFLNDLKGCQGVVANAGFTLISEALYLGKPYLAIPLRRQFEQIYNAIEVERLGFGKHWDEIDREKIEAFLFNIETYTKNLKGYERKDNDGLFRKLAELINQYS